MTRLSKFFLAVLLLTVASVSWAEESIDQWGKSHYDTYGRAEGRTLTASGNYGDYVRKYADLLAGYNASVGGSTSGSSCYGDYVRTYGDLLAAYNASGGGQSIETWGKSHYNAWGQVEGRSACVPTGDYRYLYDHNANLLGGRTRRWKSTTIQVSGVVGSWRQAVDRWSMVTNVNIVYVDSTPSDGLGFEIVGYTDLTGDVCGQASSSYWSSSGELANCTIKINSNINNMNCTKDSTMTHEVGHCLGFWGHSDDGGIMRAKGGSRKITGKTRAFINLLYSLPPGTNILSKL
jgi:hypothetical protein